MNPHDRPACRDCVHSAFQQEAATDAGIRVCLRAEGHPAARNERTDGAIVCTISGQCGVNGRFFVPAQVSLLRLPNAPRLDMEACTNPFEWILKAAEQHRADRQVVLDGNRRERFTELRALSRPVIPPK
jgi:hypothetical protein